MRIHSPGRKRLALVAIIAVPAALAAGCGSSGSGGAPSESDASGDTTSGQDATGASDAPVDAGGPGVDGAGDSGGEASTDSGGEASADAANDGSPGGGDASDATSDGAGSEAASDAGDSGQGGSDAGDGASDAPSSCNGLTNTGQVVISTFSDAGAPALTGGTIAPGRYFLVGYVVYPSIDGGGGPGPGSWQETAFVAGTTITDVQAMSSSLDGGVGPGVHSSYSFSTSGSLLTLTPTCGATIPVGSAPYQASPADGGPATFEVLVGNTLATFSQ